MDDDGLTPREILEIESDIRWRRESRQQLEDRLAAVERITFSLVIALAAGAATVLLLEIARPAPPAAATFEPLKGEP
jgi:hypothetical protein